MSAYEILLSESQERMLLVVRRGSEAEVGRVFAKWDLDAAPIGEITGDGLARCALARRTGRGGPLPRAHRRRSGVRPAAGDARLVA